MGRRLRQMPNFADVVLDRNPPHLVSTLGTRLAPWAAHASRKEYGA